MNNLYLLISKDGELFHCIWHSLLAGEKIGTPYFSNTWRVFAAATFGGFSLL